MKVLVVDDDAFSRSLAVSALNRMGHETVEADSGPEGLELFHSWQAQVVILDWMMEGMDGLELCRRLRREAREHYPYLIMLTELRGRENHEQGMAAGADDFLAKPVDKRELALRLQVAARIVQLHRRIVQLERLLPMCSYCRRIKETVGDWVTVEQYLSNHSGGAVTHGICPSCFQDQVSQLKND